MFENLNKCLDENEMVADDCLLNEIRQPTVNNVERKTEERLS